MIEKLTNRQQDVLDALAKTGGTNLMIGRMVGMSPHTVRCHLRTIFAKLGCHTRAQAVVVARQ